MTVTMIDCEAIDVPFVHQRFPFYPVAGYVSGGWPIEWSNADFSLFNRKIRIAQQPSSLVDDATIARVLDVERYAATPDDWPLFYKSRTNKGNATCYCSISSIVSVFNACADANIPPPPRWWIAWYWNRPGQPTEQIVLDQILADTGILLNTASTGTLWAAQYAPFGQYDMSAVYGATDFSRV